MPLDVYATPSARKRLVTSGLGGVFPADLNLGEITTLDLPGGSEPHGLAIGPNGSVWVALESGFVVRLPSW